MRDSNEWYCTATEKGSAKFVFLLRKLMFLINRSCLGLKQPKMWTMSFIRTLKKKNLLLYKCEDVMKHPAFYSFGRHELQRQHHRLSIPLMPSALRLPHNCQNNSIEPFRDEAKKKRVAVGITGSCPNLIGHPLVLHHPSSSTQSAFLPFCCFVRKL